MSRAPSAKSTPKGWPDGLVYLSSPRYSQGLSEDAARAIRQPTSQCHGLVAMHPSPSPCPLVRISLIARPEHPARGQHGLFATRHLAADSFVLHYLGYVHGPEDVDEASDYDNSLDREHRVGVDATLAGNEARFINDYRGVSSAGPNAEFRDCWVAVPGASYLEKRIGVYVLPAGRSGRRAKGIAKGEEILVSYGKGFWRNQQPARTAGDEHGEEVEAA